MATSKLGPKQAVLIQFPRALLKALDEASIALDMCRSDIIRRSLARDLEYVMSHEVPCALRHKKEAADRYPEWLHKKRIVI